MHLVRLLDVVYGLASWADLVGSAGPRRPTAVLSLSVRGGVADCFAHDLQGGVDAGLFLETVGDAELAGARGDQRSSRVRAVLAGQVEHPRPLAGGPAHPRVAGGGGEVAEEGDSSQVRVRCRVR